jgi:hypothetical protein
MRLHQRVGRLNRYGQKRAVSVYLLRNPETVEARIWALLEEKLQRIQAALSASMEDTEDIAQLVIGMAGNSVFDELYSVGMTKPRETLKSWWNESSNRFGGGDALETARNLLGSASKYDFSSMSQEIPKLDLQNFEPFFRNAAKTHERQVRRTDSGLSIATPELFRDDIDLRSRYDGLTFSRDLPPHEQLNRMMGIGHVLMDKLLDHAAQQPMFSAHIRGLDRVILLARVEDEVTGTMATVHRIVLGIENENSEILRDGDILLRLNTCTPTERFSGLISEQHLDQIRHLMERLDVIEFPASFGFKHPKARPIMALLPLISDVVEHG